LNFFVAEVWFFANGIGKTFRPFDKTIKERDRFLGKRSANLTRMADHVLRLFGVKGPRQTLGRRKDQFVQPSTPILFLFSVDQPVALFGNKGPECLCGSD